jgi:hypothetical protein
MFLAAMFSTGELLSPVPEVRSLVESENKKQNVVRSVARPAVVWIQNPDNGIVPAQAKSSVVRRVVAMRLELLFPQQTPRPSWPCSPSKVEDRCCQRKPVRPVPCATSDVWSLRADKEARSNEVGEVGDAGLRAGPHNGEQTEGAGQETGGNSREDGECNQPLKAQAQEELNKNILQRGSCE